MASTIITEEARERALDLVGFREVRKLERAGVRFVLTPGERHVYPRRRTSRRVRMVALTFVVVALVAIYAVKLITTAFAFIRS